MKTRDQLIFDAREICDLWFKPWGAGKGARLEGHGITVLNPDRVIERLGEILSEAEELRAVSAAVHGAVRRVHADEWTFFYDEDRPFWGKIVDGVITEVSAPDRRAK